jgi:putative copper resistance protein D
LFATAALVGIGGYLAGVRRLARAGEEWPRGRTVAWISGWLVVAAATDLELSRVGHQLFTLIQAAQHFAFIAIAPVLLVSGGGVALARRALRPATERGMRGPREWLPVLLYARLTRFACIPAVAVCLYGASLYAMYASAAQELVLRSHAGHVGTFGAALALGCLFFWPLFGIEPAPWPLTAQARFTLLLSGLALQGVLGVAILRDIPLRTLAGAGAVIVVMLAGTVQLSMRVADEPGPVEPADGSAGEAGPAEASTGPASVPRQRSPETTGPRTGP